MENANVEIVPLTEGEKEWLMNIYELRSKYYFQGGLIKCALLWTVVAFPVYALVFAFHDILTSHANPWLAGSGIHHVSIILAIAALCVTVHSLILYYTWMLPFRSDALSGQKYIRQFAIERKEYFPVTGQYFIYIEGIENHLEVDASTYDKYEEGDRIPLKQAILTKYIFMANNHVLIKLFASGTGMHESGYGSYNW